MKILKIIIPILLAVVLVVLGKNLLEKRKAQNSKEDYAQKYAIVVDTITPKITQKTLSLPYIAEVKNDKETIINSKFSGKVLYIANLGDYVKKGDIIVKIDDSDLKAKLDEINSQILSIKQKIKAQEINLDNLILTHNRTKKLLEVKMASIEEYQNEENKIASLKAEIKSSYNNLKSLVSNKNSIQNNISYTIIKAPIDGIISQTFINKNETTFTAKPILKITPKNGNYLFITLPKKYNTIIYKNKKYNLITLNNTQNGLLTFRADINDSSLLTNQKVNIDVVEYEGKGCFIPYDAILSIDSKNYIFTPQPISIKILAKGKNEVLIDKNITQKIIVAKPDILLKIKAGYPIKEK